MENLEYIQHPTQEKSESAEKIIQDIQELQKIETENAQILKLKDKNIPSHIQEFLVVDPKQLSKIDLEAFEKFQEFLERKEKIGSLIELQEIMDYFKNYKLQCDKESRKFTVLQKMKQEGKSMKDITQLIQQIDQETNISDNSKFFMDYIVNVVNGENVLLISKLSDSEIVHSEETKMAHTL